MKVLLVFPDDYKTFAAIYGYEDTTGGKPGKYGKASQMYWPVVGSLCKYAF